MSFLPAVDFFYVRVCYIALLTLQEFCAKKQRSLFIPKLHNFVYFSSVYTVWFFVRLVGLKDSCYHRKLEVAIASFQFLHAGELPACGSNWKLPSSFAGSTPPCQKYARFHGITPLTPPSGASTSPSYLGIRWMCT